MNGMKNHGGCESVLALDARKIFWTPDNLSDLDKTPLCCVFIGSVASDSEATTTSRHKSEWFSS